MPRFVVYPYKMGSASAKLLARELSAIRVYPDREYRPKEQDVIVNWGNGHTPMWNTLLKTNNQVINNWKNVCFAIDKWQSFKKFCAYGVHTPDFTSHRSKAIDWIADGNVVIGRTQLEGTRGTGICVMENPTQFQECIIYTKYVEPTKEFRIYTFNGAFLDALEKRRDTERLQAGTIDYRVRTEENGWVFCRNGVSVPAEAAKQAIKATEALGLIFGGVDVIWNQPKNKATVLEVNTAPGIFGGTVPMLAAKIIEFAKAA